MLTQPYIRSNLIQVNAFRENTCLLVGLSLTDPNLRRLLAVAAETRPEPAHYLFMRRVTESLVAHSQPGIELPPHLAREFLNAHRLQEQACAELGVRVLWFEEYEELPDFIDFVGQR